MHSLKFTQVHLLIRGREGERKGGVRSQEFYSVAQKTCILLYVNLVSKIHEDSPTHICNINFSRLYENATPLIRKLREEKGREERKEREGEEKGERVGTLMQNPGYATVE